MAYFKVLSLNFPGYAEEHHEKRVRITGFRAEIYRMRVASADTILRPLVP